MKSSTAVRSRSSAAWIPAIRCRMAIPSGVFGISLNGIQWRKAYPVSNQQASVAAEESKHRKVRAAQGNRTCEIIGAFQSGTCVLRDKENLSFLQNTIPRTGKTASALLHTVCTCEFITCSQSNEGCVTRFISRANSALELRLFSKLWVAEDDTAGFGAISRGIPDSSQQLALEGRANKTRAKWYIEMMLAIIKSNLELTILE